jgi:hypothetical protein
MSQTVTSTKVSCRTHAADGIQAPASEQRDPPIRSSYLRTVHAVIKSLNSMESMRTPPPLRARHSLYTLRRNCWVIPDINPVPMYANI